MTADQPPGVRYVQALGPADVGARVVLRRRLPGGGLGDVLGQLESWEHGTLVVRTAAGAAVDVAQDDLVAAKRVPPAPARRGTP